ncbi:hypothetical protein SDC9_184081 [bioreactor metagenome]|uniref:Uncharacterized protein n=1 Tax=bioreactor metagenome TaxID=1076179 RepID=A0A645HDY2_9ZZZZ
MRIASLFAGINWTELNAKYKRDYTKAAAVVLGGLESSSDEKEQILAEVNRVYEAIKLLDIKIKRGSPRRSKQMQQMEKH